MPRESPRWSHSESPESSNRAWRMEGEGERRPGERRKAGRATGPWSPERKVESGELSYSSISPRPRPETADRQRDRQPHARHVDEQGQRPECRQRSLDVGEVERPQRGRQRNDTAVHDEEPHDPVEEPARHGPLDHRGNPPAEPIEDRRGGERDTEVHRETERRGGGAVLE